MPAHADSIPRLTNAPRILVTGATAGIGRAAAEALARLGAEVLVGARDAEKGEATRRAIVEATGNERVTVLLVDVASQASIRAAAARLVSQGRPLDVLLNNAGVIVDERRTSPDGIELTFATNVLGYHLLTHELLPLVERAASGRVVNVASGYAFGLDLADVEFARRPYDKGAAYAQSKQANRMLTWALARRLAAKGARVTANAMTPGPVDTDLLRKGFGGMRGKPAPAGADTAVWLAASPEVAGVSGRFFADRREQDCPFHDERAEEALWSLCDRACGIR